MSADDENIIYKIEDAFQHRKMPHGPIILPEYDLSAHVEAQRLDKYLRTNQAVVDRSNYAMVCFIYITAEAALWVLPSGMISVVKNFSSDDFFIDILSGALADGQPDTEYKPQGDLGIRMRQLADGKERDAVYQFCNWLGERVPDAGGGQTLSEAKKLWS